MLGGTFDPVHNGHLRMALEVLERLSLDALNLVPVCTPALRSAARATPAQRAEMLRIAIAPEPRLRVDERELARGGVSYTIDTLREMRHETGDADSLCLVVGEDAFAGLERWKEWRRLLDYAHIVVLTRPGDTPVPRGALAAWTEEHLAADPEQALSGASRGSILHIELTQLAISSTQVRALLADGRSPRYLVPDGVLDYIHEHRIYAAGAAGAGETA
jgi:nicotinate-nucleotide adenylyltransferase